MARYADTLLANGEVVAMRTRQHWTAIVRDILYPIVILIAVIVIFLLISGQSSEGFFGTVKSVLTWLSLGGLVIAIVWSGLVIWRWASEDYLVTNRRVLKVEGVLNKHSADSALDKINDAVLDQSIIGRMLDFGDLDILTANEDSVDRYKRLNHAPAFKREMLEQKNNLEMDIHQLPSPPLRTGVPAGAAAATAGAATAGAATAPPAMSPDEVTATLAKLADLRDRGAISAEEYDAKKADLLGRI
ncbi:MAG TPA: PH domain-containing protein [Candidatus Binatia bacterium]|nr:PH domain-containing protein [Candidatus Binatia bacterium]